MRNAQGGGSSVDSEQPEDSSKVNDPMGPRAGSMSRGYARRRELRQDDPGFDLECRVGRVEFAEGALVRLRVPVRAEAEAGRDVLTDLDVVAVDVDSRLRFGRSILECKSGKGQSKEPDRLLWLSGLRAYMRGPRAVLVRQTISARGRLMARRLGIEAMDTKQLSQLEAAVSWVPDRFAHVGGAECALAEKRTDEQIQGLGYIDTGTVGFLRHDALFADPLTILVQLMQLGSVTADQGSLPVPANFTVGGHALMALLLAALSDAQRLDVMPREMLKDKIERALTVGGSDAGDLLTVLESADNLFGHVVESLHDAYVSVSGVGKIDVDVPKLLDLVAVPPIWVDRYLDLVESLRANGSISSQLLQTAELSVFEGLAGGDKHLYSSFDHLFTVEHRQLLRLAVLTLTKITGSVITEGLEGISNMPFDRHRPAVPDRRGNPERSKGL
ncbi:hypothetical protein CMMCAS02_14565 [Clavibacter michiganensis subsp. michiganensis]|nr:hypothetical protein CMMCAS02_14565 [Clavibacter michiganensis subsp. michiganensis]OUD88904.1 hypothetical protein CMMCAS03_12055 [Clavibacter michiganensis subsp. michiganensis]OUE17413.1 hypothetical protein CMMCA002_14740 [Clavibacter michiganensis subsp. michiganensis]SLJ98239.1 hypothetical protein SAMN06265879_2191 [Clavibacter michiganensis]